MKPKTITKTKWVVTADGDEPHDWSDDFDTKGDAKDAINNQLLGKNFVIYKTITRFIPVQTINKKLPRPCYGGWGQGHTISEEDRKNKTENPFCTGCGYKLKRVGFEGNLRLVKPLVQKTES